MADCVSLQLHFKLHRKECDTVADSLQQAGIEAAAYHAGLGDSDRIHVQDRWLSGDNCKVGGCGSVSGRLLSGQGQTVEWVRATAS